MQHPMILTKVFFISHIPHSQHSAAIGLSSFAEEAACRLVACDFPDPDFSIQELPAT